MLSHTVRCDSTIKQSSLWMNANNTVNFFPVCHHSTVESAVVFPTSANMLYRIAFSWKSFSTDGNYFNNVWYDSLLFHKWHIHEISKSFPDIIMLQERTKLVREFRVSNVLLTELQTENIPMPLQSHQFIKELSRYHILFMC